MSAQKFSVLIYETSFPADELRVSVTLVVGDKQVILNSRDSFELRTQAEEVAKLLEDALNHPSNEVDDRDRARVDSIDAHFWVGHRGGMVVINNYGNQDVPPNWSTFTPDEARKLAEHLVLCADAAEHAVSRSED